MTTLSLAVRRLDPFRIPPLSQIRVIPLHLTCPCTTILRHQSTLEVLLHTAHIRTLPSPLQLAIFSIIFLRLAAAGKAEATNLWAFRIRTANRMVQALTCAR